MFNTINNGSNWQKIGLSSVLYLLVNEADWLSNTFLIIFSGQSSNKGYTISLQLHNLKDEQNSV